MTTREALTEVINKLFVYADLQKWASLQKEVLADAVYLDMSSTGGAADEFSSKEICHMWQEGFKDIDAVNHLVGNILFESVTENEAIASAYATATHFKDAAENGKTREFFGTYDIRLRKLNESWNIYSFVFNLKFANGNLELK